LDAAAAPTPVSSLDELTGQPAADAAASSASSPPDHRAEPPAIPHALMLVLSRLDDSGLRREFDAHADLAALAASAEDKGERRMSKDGLAKFMRDKGLAHGDAEVERVMKRVDTNGDLEIDFLEFCALARANSDLELGLRSLHLEVVLASFFPMGTKLQDLADMDHAQFSAIVDSSKQNLVQLLVGFAAQVAAVGKAQDGAGGSKFSGELKGGKLDDFHKGVGICGDPDADIEKGMREEHTMLPGSDVEFSTPNYGLGTTPAKEWALVFEGGNGCEEVEGKEDSVIVTGTRGGFLKGQTQPDVRVLRPISHYGDFGEDGRLKDLRPCDSDTPIQRRVKKAGLRRCDVVALILYTGVFVNLCGCMPRARMQSLSQPTAPCRFPSMQSMMMPAQANHYHPRALTTHAPPIFRAHVCAL
jgi:hypothetical protein